jgi:hypothetical protein
MKDVSMTEISNIAETETPIEVDPIEVINKGQCTSLSGQSELEFEVGQHSEDDSLHIRLSGNTGAGLYCPNWVSATDIQDIVLGATQMTSTSVKPLFEGKSNNSAGFLLACLRELGLVRVSASNSRHHEHVPGSTFAQLVKTHSNAPKSRRKGGG